MREIILVEDVRSQAEELAGSLMAAGFIEPEWKITIWHVNSDRAYGTYLDAAASTTARIMIADLALIDRQAGPSDVAILKIAKARAQARQMTDESGFWRWDRPKRSQLLPGAVLIQTYIDAQADERAPIRKHVWIASNLHEDAAPWYVKLRADVEASGRMDQDTVAVRVKSFIKRAYEDWPAILWNEETQNWFRSEPPYYDDHDPHLLDPSRLREQKLRLSRITGNVFGFDPPKHWFDDNDQFQHLFDCFKGLTGFHSCASGVLRDRNVYLGTLVVLLGLALRDSKVPPSVAAGVLSQVTFCSSSAPFLPVSKEWFDVQRRIERLVREVFARFVWHRSDPKRFIIVGVTLNSRAVELTLDFDCSLTSPGRTKSFMEKIHDNSHSAVAYLRTITDPRIAVTVSRTDLGQTKLQFLYE